MEFLVGMLAGVAVSVAYAKIKKVLSDDSEKG